MFVLGHCKEFSYTLWFWTTKVCFTLLDGRNLRSKCGEAGCSVKAGGQSPSLTLPTSLWSLEILGTSQFAGSFPDPPLPLSHMICCVQLCLPPAFWEEDYPWVSSPHQTQYDSTLANYFQRDPLLKIRSCKSNQPTVYSLDSSFWQLIAWGIEDATKPSPWPGGACLPNRGERSGPGLENKLMFMGHCSLARFCGGCWAHSDAWNH